MRTARLYQVGVCQPPLFGDVANEPTDSVLHDIQGCDDRAALGYRLFLARIGRCAPLNLLSREHQRLKKTPCLPVCISLA
jgi:hypothetical protein